MFSWTLSSTLTARQPCRRRLIVDDNVHLHDDDDASTSCVVRRCIIVVHDVVSSTDYLVGVSILMRRQRWHLWLCGRRRRHNEVVIVVSSSQMRLMTSFSRRCHCDDLLLDALVRLILPVHLVAPDAYYPNPPKHGIPYIGGWCSRWGVSWHPQIRHSRLNDGYEFVCSTCHLPASSHTTRPLARLGTREYNICLQVSRWLVTKTHRSNCVLPVVMHGVCASNAAHRSRCSVYRDCPGRTAIQHFLVSYPSTIILIL